MQNGIIPSNLKYFGFFRKYIVSPPKNKIVKGQPKYCLNNIKVIISIKILKHKILNKYFSLFDE